VRQCARFEILQLLLIQLQKRPVFVTCLNAFGASNRKWQRLEQGAMRQHMH
jgi:hypothetical protein